MWHLKGFDGGDAAVGLTLVVIAREWSRQDGPGVPQVDGLLHGDVAPVGDFDGASDAADGEEWRVVLVVDLHGILSSGRHSDRSHSFLRPAAGNLKKVPVTRMRRAPG